MSITRPTSTKALPPTSTKDLATIDRGAALYPEADGWRPCFNGRGDRVGFYCDAHGFKDDPDSLRHPAPDPISEAIRTNPDVVAAFAAAEAAGDRVRQAEADHAAAAFHALDLESNSVDVVFERGEMKTIVKHTRAEINAARQRAADLFEVAELAAREFRKLNSRANRAQSDLRHDLTADAFSRGVGFKR